MRRRGIDPETKRVTIRRGPEQSEGENRRVGEFTQGRTKDQRGKNPPYTSMKLRGVTAESQAKRCGRHKGRVNGRSKGRDGFKL